MGNLMGSTSVTFDGQADLVNMLSFSPYLS